jgi:tetratricopeptide (TPR) repeat protein
MKVLKLIMLRLLIVLTISMSVVGCTAEHKKNRALEKAKAYFAAGNYENAKLEYFTVLRIEPNNATALEQLGLLWLERGANVTALPYLLKVKELAPTRHDNWLRLANAYRAVGKTMLAKREAEAALERLPGNADALYLLAQTMRSPDDLAKVQQQLNAVTSRSDSSYHLASATVAVRSGDLAAANMAIMRALAIDPKSHTAHAAMAAIHLIKQDSTGAAKEFKLAADVAPLRSPARLQYAEFKARNGEVEEAIAMLEESTRKAPDYLPAWITLAQIALSQKKYDEALARLKQVFKWDATNYDARLLQTQVWMAKGDVAKAVTELELIGKKHPGLAGDKYLLAQAYLHQKDVPKAMTALTQTLQANEDHDEAAMLLAQLHLNTGTPEPALGIMVNLLSRRPSQARAQLLLLDALRALKRHDDAVKVLEEQIRAYPQNPQPFFLLGLIQREQNKIAEARASFEQSVKLAPDRIPPIAQLVDLDLRDKDYARATERARALIEKLPGSADAQYLEARVYAAAGKWKEVESALFKTIDLDSNYVPAYQMLTQMYVSVSRLPAPLERLESWVARQPDNLHATLLLALVQWKQGAHAKTREIYEKLLARKPDSSLVLNNLAYFYAEHLNDLGRAQELASKAREADPDSAAVADTLGWILYKKGEHPRALELLKESATKLPDNPEIQFHFGVINQAMGQNDAAREAFRKAASFADEFPGKSELKQRIAQLDKAVPPAVRSGPKEN